ncbi:hypothetical protein [Ancrocorticia populi]|uniref:hypothetical protein n=1 Tax=Ancrocorticia populi TaxID=2175228 RepID=UPI003F900F74
MTDGPDLRPLGTGGETAPPLDSTPLVQPDSGIIGGGPAAAVEPSRLLPAAPSYADPAKARAVRNQLDPVGHWDAVVACATMPDGTLQVDGAVHVFLNSAVLVRQLGGPAHAGLDIRKARLVSLLNDGLNQSCAGFWLYGLAPTPQFLPAQILAPMADTLSAIVTLAKAASRAITPDEAASQLSSHTFFYSEPAAEPLELFLSPVHLLSAGKAGNAATATLDEATDGLSKAFVIEPGTGYELAL